MWAFNCVKVQDMKDKHEKETNLKAQRDLMAKDAADREAAAQVQSEPLAACQVRLSMATHAITTQLYYNTSCCCQSYRNTMLLLLH